MRDFSHTVNVLVKAFMDGTLQISNCAACAVGNMIADSCGYKFKHQGKRLQWLNGDVLWHEVFASAYGVPRPVKMYNYVGDTKIQIDSTGYALSELQRIEQAFEESTAHIKKDDNDIDAQFIGLMAVVDVLADIHGIDLKAKEEAKLLFVKV